MYILHSNALENIIIGNVIGGKKTCMYSDTHAYLYTCTIDQICFFFVRIYFRKTPCDYILRILYMFVILLLVATVYSFINIEWMFSHAVLSQVSLRTLNVTNTYSRRHDCVHFPINIYFIF